MRSETSDPLAVQLAQPCSTTTLCDMPDSETPSPHTRYALILFAIYVALYAGFMALNAFAPHLMQRAPFGGVNLAILYGLGLIVAAVVLALLYTLLCRRANP